MALPAWVPGPEGYDVLPVGVHRCLLGDVVSECAKGRPDELRRLGLLRDLTMYVQKLDAVGLAVEAVWLDGSFVSGKINPGDIDCSPIIDYAGSDPDPAELPGLWERWIHPRNRWKHEPVPGLGHTVGLDIYGFVSFPDPQESADVRAHWQRWWQTSRASTGDLDKGLVEVRFA